MKTTLEKNNREAIIKAGFNYGGSTTDETILGEIARDYSKAGYVVRFNKDTRPAASDKVTFWLKRRNQSEPEPWTFRSSIN